MDATDSELLYEKINLETAKIHWHELQRFFAQGKVLAVAEDKDLVNIATAIANNESASINQLISSGQIEAVTDTQAKKWYASNELLWAVVVAPWVLVQQIKQT